jgi:hypothetical protein
MGKVQPEGISLSFVTGPCRSHLRHLLACQWAPGIRAAPAVLVLDLDRGGIGTGAATKREGGTVAPPLVNEACQRQHFAIPQFRSTRLAELWLRSGDGHASLNFSALFNHRLDGVVVVNILAVGDEPRRPPEGTGMTVVPTRWHR